MVKILHLFTDLNHALKLTDSILQELLNFFYSRRSGQIQLKRIGRVIQLNFNIIMRLFFSVTKKYFIIGFFA